MMTLYDDTMRTIIDIPEQNIHALDAVCDREHISRAEAVRRAVSDYLLRYKPDEDAAFGIWQGRGQDGMAYQAALREEWDASGNQAFTVHEPPCE